MSKEQILPMSEAQSAEGLRQLSPEEAEIVSADPATFVIACAVLARLRDSITELRDLICRGKPELGVVFDKVVAKMSNVGLLKIFGDQFVVIKPGTYLDFTKNLDFSFLPKIASILSERILKNARTNSLAKGERIRWYYLTSHPEIEKRLVQIQNQWQSEMEKLVEWAEAHPEIVGDKVRLTMMISGNLNAEDAE